MRSLAESNELKQKYLENLLSTRKSKEICASIGISEDTPYYWRKHDPEFNEAYETIIQAVYDRAMNVLVDQSEEVAMSLVNAALEGDSKQKTDAIKLFFNVLGRKMTTVTPASIDINVEW